MPFVRPLTKLATTADATAEMARIREGVIGSGPRPPEEMFEWVFAGLPEHLRRQRDEVLGPGG